MVQNPQSSESGIKYSALIELSYFDPIRFVIVDPMHNLFLDTAKRMMKIWTDWDLVTKNSMTVIQTVLIQSNLLMILVVYLEK